jgi:hypothetical protein
MRQLRRKTLAAHVAPAIPASTISFIKTYINMFRRMPSGDESRIELGGRIGVGSVFNSRARLSTPLVKVLRRRITLGADQSASKLSSRSASPRSASGEVPVWPRRRCWR